MVVLADEILESFFETDFTATFKLEPVPMLEIPNSNSGIFGGLWQTITSDDSKKIFHKFSDEVGKSFGRHSVGISRMFASHITERNFFQVVYRPAIGKFTTLEEPKARESLLTPTMRRSASKASLNTSTSTPSTDTSSYVTPSTSLATDQSISHLSVEVSSSNSIASSEFSPMPGMFEAAAHVAALMERTPFAIDDAKDDDEDTDLDDSDVEDDGVMDEVDAFLEEHDTGLTEAERDLAKGEFLF